MGLARSVRAMAFVGHGGIQANVQEGRLALSSTHQEEVVGIKERKRRLGLLRSTRRLLQASDRGGNQVAKARDEKEG